MCPDGSRSNSPPVAKKPFASQRCKARSTLVSIRAQSYILPVSKAEILSEIPKLSPAEREEILERLWELEEREMLNGGKPTAAEMVLLDRELKEYGSNPTAGSTLDEVEARLRKPQQ